MPLLRGKQTILLPVSPLFIKSTLFLSFLLYLLSGKMGLFFNTLDAVFLFWCLRESLIVKTETAFLIGLTMDFYFNQLIGQNALCYTLMAILSHYSSCRFMSLPIKAQAFLLSVLLLIKNVMTSLLVFVLYGKSLAWETWWSTPLITGLLYPFLLRLLLSPQLKPTSSEETPI